MKTTFFKVDKNPTKPIKIDFESITLIEIAKEYDLTMKTLRNLLKYYNGETFQ